MKSNHQQFNQRLHPLMPDVSRPSTAPYKSHIEIEFAPSADEVAARVHLKYGNQGSLPEEELEHWLEAEAQLLAASQVTWLRALSSLRQRRHQGRPGTNQRPRISVFKTDLARGVSVGR